jgi:hypothetical protein
MNCSCSLAACQMRKGGLGCCFFASHMHKTRLISCASNPMLALQVINYRLVARSIPPPRSLRPCLHHFISNSSVAEVLHVPSLHHLSLQAGGQKYSCCQIMHPLSSYL